MGFFLQLQGFMEFYCCASLNWYGLEGDFAAWQRLKERFAEDPEKSFHSIKEKLKKLEGYSWLQYCQEVFEIRERLAESGGHYISIFDETYPEELKNCHRPVALIIYKGQLNLSPEFRRVCVVGSRNVSEASIKWLETEYCEWLKQAQVKAITVSGGARGVDQVAHGVALRLQRPTWCFVPSGIFKLYPANLKKWESYIIESGGAFVSCFHPEHELRNWYFHRRNEVMAALSSHTLIVEAKRRSGTMVTAAKAIEMGRNVLVVPNHPYSDGRGGLDLLADGAQLVCDAKDLKWQIDGIC